MQTAMESLKTMVDVNTILGDPVETPDGAVIVPVSRVTFGFAAGEATTPLAISPLGKKTHCPLREVAVQGLLSIP